MVEDLIKRLRDTVEEEAGHGVRNEAADLIEQQVARLTALESERDALKHDIERHIANHSADLTAAGKEAVGQAGAMPGTDGFTMACFKASDVPIGTPLYTAPTAAVENGDGRDAWQPIETAPKDGTWILMTNGVDVAGGQWVRDEGGTTEYRDEDGRYLGQTDRDDFEGWMDWMGGMPSPTHWQPLTALPAALSQKAGEQQ
jgi:hypothetical protein